MAVYDTALVAEKPRSKPRRGFKKPETIGGAAQLAGAALSVSLLLGVIIWAYVIISRDVSGVPVVRAAEGPTRIQPEQPGGNIADHQGLSVNAVAAVGTASRAADRVILAPAPLDLSQEQAATEPVVSAPAETISVPTTPAETTLAEAAETALESDGALQLAAVEALATALANGVDPITPTDTATEPAPEVAAAPEADAAPVDGGLGRSLRPQMRPAGLGGLPLTVSEAQPVASDEIDPATLPEGTRLAQLGAYASPEIAREEWNKLADKFGEYLDGKGRVIQKATSGGRTFYRLRAQGFDDLSDARRFCSALVAERAECIPVVTR